MFKAHTIGLVLFLGLFMGSNLWAAAGPEETKAALEQRVTKYWAARQSRDIKTVYEMESASLPGGWLTLDRAMAVAGLPVRNVKIEELTVEGEQARVRVSGDVLVGTLGWMPQTLKDNWVLINGQWYHETRRPGSPASQDSKPSNSN